MGFAVKQYGRWLRDNYADLENKEVRLSYALITVIQLLIMIYGFDGEDLTINYIVQFIERSKNSILVYRQGTM